MRNGNAISWFCRQCFVAALVVLTATTLGCAAPAQPTPAAPRAYLSVWAQLYPESLEKTRQPGSLQGEFHTAANARDEATARERWQRFLDEFDPKDGYFEDAMHARFVEWARTELARLRHRLAGNTQAEASQIENMRQRAAAMNLR